jgi:hypothetical protein
MANEAINQIMAIIFPVFGLLVVGKLNRNTVSVMIAKKTKNTVDQR